MMHGGNNDVVIVGGGASAVLVALALLPIAPAQMRIGWVAPVPQSQLGQGIAYSTPFAAHLLNVPAAGMSADATVGDDFLQFLQAHDSSAGAQDFAPRKSYAAYLAQHLQKALAQTRTQVHFLEARAQQLHATEQGWQLALDNGQSVQARQVVLAIGNNARPLPKALADVPADVGFSAWDWPRYAQIGADDAVGILGTGLSMVDVVLQLQQQGHRGPIHALSRHGLLPQAHVANDAAFGVDDAQLAALCAMTLPQRVRWLRQQAAALQAQGRPWQALLNALRPHVRKLWQSLDVHGQRQFLRHVVRYWDCHRHRIAQSVDHQLQQLLQSGQLQVRAGHISGAQRQGQGIVLQQTGQSPLPLRWLVNASGVQTRADAIDCVLVRQLLDEGIAQPGAHGLGLACDAFGQIQSGLYSIGSLRIGQLWESIAIPDLREDAALLAKRIVLVAANNG